MTQIASRIRTMIPEPARQVQTRGVEDNALGSLRSGDDQNQPTWQRVIDDQLIEWGRNPSLLEEDDLIPPTQAALDRARRIIAEMMSTGQPAPMRVVPDGDGGIGFERWCDSVTASIEIAKNGTAEIVLLQDGRVVGRSAFVPGM